MSITPRSRDCGVIIACVAEEAAHDERIRGELSGQHLQRVFLLEEHVPHSIDGRHASFADAFEDLVLIESFADQRIVLAGDQLRAVE